MTTIATIATIPPSTSTSVDGQAPPSLGRDEVLAEISRLVGERTDTASIAPDDNFFDLGVESLMLVEIKEAIYDRFAVTVKFSDFFSHFTVETLADLVVSRASDSPDGRATGSDRASVTVGVSQ